jgi:hypothetical protein
MFIILMMKQSIMIMVDQNNYNHNFKFLIGINWIILMLQLIQILQNYFLIIFKNVFFNYQTNRPH